MRFEDAWDHLIYVKIISSSNTVNGCLNRYIHSLQHSGSGENDIGRLITCVLPEVHEQELKYCCTLTDIQSEKSTGPVPVQLLKDKAESGTSSVTSALCGRL